MSDRPSFTNSYLHSYQKEAYTPPVHSGATQQPRTVTERREPYAPPELGELQSFQGTSRGRNLNHPAAASTSAVQVPPGHPFSGTNDNLIDQFKQSARQAGRPQGTIDNHVAALRNFGNWAGENSLQEVLNSTSSTYAQQAVRDWKDLPANENAYGNAGNSHNGGGGAITAFRRSFGWGRDDA